MTWDLDAIRARHAPHEEAETLCDYCGLDWPCDTAALLAALDAAHLETLAQAARHADCCVDRQDLAQAQAVLDRLAGVTPEEVAQAIAGTPGPHPSGVGTIWHGLPWAETSPANQATYRAMAAAVLARLAGP